MSSVANSPLIQCHCPRSKGTVAFLNSRQEIHSSLAGLSQRQLSPLLMGYNLRPAPQDLSIVSSLNRPSDGSKEKFIGLGWSVVAFRSHESRPGRLCKKFSATCFCLRFALSTDSVDRLVAQAARLHARRNTLAQIQSKEKTLSATPDHRFSKSRNCLLPERVPLLSGIIR